MFKKTLKVLSLVAVLGLSANANDLLVDISKGAISDNSLGVKVLNPEQMSEVRGGYRFYRYSNFDFRGGIPSYAYIITDDSGSLSNISKIFNLPMREIIVVQERYLNGKMETFLQSFDIFTKQKVRDVLLNFTGQEILDTFRRARGY